MDIVFTIISRNYLALAVTLMASVGENDPSVHRIVVTTDGATVLGLDDVETIDVWDIPGISPAMALYYSALEFNTAVKPFAFGALLNRQGVRTVTYLDPDILLFRALDRVRLSLEKASIALTPHLTRPLGLGGAPDDLGILRSGAYNLGFLAARPTPDTHALMAWWAERCRFDCRVDFAEGLFTDQRWMDLAPGLVDRCEIVRDPGLNLAYWNLSGRSLSLSNGVWLVDGQPLTFFHFSGFDPSRSDQLSRYQDRIDERSDPILLALLRDYGDRLIANGHLSWSKTRYGHAHLSDGRELTPSMRRLALEAARLGTWFSKPSAQSSAWFDQQAGTELGAKAVERTGAWGRLGRRPALPPTPQEGVLFDLGQTPARAVEALWRTRPDLQDRFALDDPGLLAWCIGPEALAGRFSPRLLPTSLQPSSERSALAERAARFVLKTSTASRDLLGLRILFGLAPAAGWPDTQAFVEARQAWGLPEPVSRLPRLLHKIWLERPDLQAQFDIKNLSGRLRFRRWFARTGLIEMGLVEDSLPKSVTLHPAHRLSRPIKPKPRSSKACDKLLVIDSGALQGLEGQLVFIADHRVFQKSGKPASQPARVRKARFALAPDQALAAYMALSSMGVQIDNWEGM